LVVSKQNIQIEKGEQGVKYAASEAISFLQTLRIDNKTLHSLEVIMAHDFRFALIDKDGKDRFAAIINGTFQIGKNRRRLPKDIETFARAILIEGEDGRFVRADGTKPGVLKFRGNRSFEAVAYRIDAALAARLNIPAFGAR
jgi:hypothetical protein